MIRLSSNKTLFLFVLFFSAFILRVYNFGNYPFGFDQVQIANEASNITHGDFTFIGPRTGPAHMFTGPLVYYVAALFTFFVPSHYAVILTALFFSMSTGIVLYLLAKKYLSQEFAQVIAVLWAFSPFLIHFDRIPWNPNLSIVASALVFFPLLKTRLGLDLKDVLLISLGVFLGYQAHFSGLLLWPLALGSFFFLSQKKKIMYFILSSMAFLLSLLPTVIFDYRNNWLNARGFYELITNKEQVGIYSVLPRVSEKLFISIETLGRVLFNFNTESLILVTGLTCIGYFLYAHRKQNEQRISVALSCIWFGTVVVFYALYRESTPEYYYLLLIPACLHILSTVLLRGFNNKQRNVLLGIFVLASSALIYEHITTTNGFSLQHQLSVHTALREISRQSPIQRVVYDMEDVETVGMKYLLEKDPIMYQKEGVVVHIQYPVTSKNLVTRMVSDNAGVWVDSRTNPSKNYVTKKDYIIAVPKGWVVYEDLQQEKYPEAEATYVFFEELRKETGSLYVFDKENASDFSPQVQSVFASKPQQTNETNPSSWSVFDTGFVSFYKQKMFVLEASDSTFVQEQIEILVK